MAFNRLMLTTQGKTLFAKAQQGKKMHFTRVGVGDGDLGNGSMVNRTTLVNEKLSLAIDAVQLTNEAMQAAILTALKNDDISAGFYFRELGVFAKDPDTNAEVLYLYDNAGSDGEYIPDNASGVKVNEYLKLLIAVDNEENITFEASGNPMYLTKDDIDDSVSSKYLVWSSDKVNTELTNKADKANPHAVTAAQVGAVPTSRTVNGKALNANIALTYTDVGADPAGTASAEVSTHNTSITAHSTQFEGKADKSHNHDERYYTEAEVNVLLNSVRDTVGVINYTLSEKTITREVIPVLSTNRTLLAAATDGKGNVLFGGGCVGTNSPLSTVDKYDIYGISITLAPLSAARAGLNAATDGKGNVLFSCGRTGTDSYSKNVDKYSMDGVKTSLNQTSNASSRTYAATNASGEVLFGFGGTINKYDNYGTRTIIAAPELNLVVSMATDGAGNVLIFDSGTKVFKCDIYGVVTSLPSVAKAGHGVACTNGIGCVLYAGGGGITDVEKYDTLGTKTILTPLTASSGDICAAADGNGGVLFASGGTRVERYDCSDVRTIIEPLHRARSAAAAATDGNGSVLFGGGTVAPDTGVDKYLNPPVLINIPLGAKYKFKNELTEKTYTDTSGAPLKVPTPNNGYVKFGGNVTI